MTQMKTKEDKIRIAYKQLVDCAENKTTVTYGKIGDAIGEAARNVGRYLDAINDETDEQFGVLLSVLAVYKSKCAPDKRRPSNFFYQKVKVIWERNINPDDPKSCEDFFLKESKRLHKLALAGKLK